MKHKQTLRRGLGILLSLVMCLGLLPATALAEETETGKAIQIGTLQVKGGQASSVYLGNYKQSSDGINGYNTDPIKWRVLSNADGKLFLLAGQNLDAQQYNSSDTSITWEKSTIRSWLNGYGANENTYETDYSRDNFIDAAFSKEEQGAIAETFVYNATQSDGSSSPNPKYDIPGGNNTTDKIFLLSIEEANNSSYFPNGNDSRKSINTAYVASRHTNMHGAGEADFWRLRSPGIDDDMAALVTDKGGVWYDGGDVNFTYDAVRPAFNLNLNSVLFTSAAEGGKSASGMGSGLASVGDYTGNEWKLTLLDSSRSGFTASTETVADNKVTIAYSNATTGSNEYISAIVQDADGSVPYYGRIAQLDGTTNTDSGTVSITLPEGFDKDTDTLCVFNEQYNGDKMTDYASALCTLSFSKPISGCTVDPIPSQTYTGEPLTPAVTIRDGDVTLTKDTDYTVSYKNNVNAGMNATVTITGKGEYGGETSATFTIRQADPIKPTGLTGVEGQALSTVQLPSGWSWNSGQQSLIIGQKAYLAYYSGSANYSSGYTYLDVDVQPKPVDTTTMTVAQEGCTYGETLPDYALTGKPAFSSETALYTGTLAKDNSDYSSADKPTEAGTYTVKVTCGTKEKNYEATASFTIAPRSIEGFTVTLSDTALAYTGDSQSVTVTAVGNLAAGDYEVSAPSGTNAGEYTVTVTGKGNYTGAATATWRITKIDPPIPTGLTGVKGKPLSTVRLPDGWWWNDPAAILNASGTFKASYSDETGNYNNVSGVDVAVTLVEGYTVTAYGLYGETMEITPGDTYTGIFAAGEMVRLQIGKRDGYTLKDLTLAGITEDQLKWSAKDQEINDRGIGFTMPETDVTVTVNWQRIGGSGGGSTATYAIAVDSAKNGAVTASHQTASEGTTVTLTVTPDKGYTLETLTVTDGSGKKLALTDKGSGKYSFKMPASKATVKATFMEDNSMLNFFVDVPASAYYYDAVLWAAENGITGGTDAVHFSPDNACTRAQAVTFLWRAAGSPAPESRVNPFTDVKADAYYYDAVLWAVEQGITKGTTDTTFSPNATCTRAQIVTFLWRAQGSSAAGTGNPFADVAADAYYANAVLWAAENGITGGTTATTFSPASNCTRAQIVTFLFRCLGEG